MSVGVASGQFALAIDDPMGRYRHGFIQGMPQGPTHHPGGSQGQEVGDGAIGGNPSPRNDPDDIIDGFEIGGIHLQWIGRQL